MAKGISSEPQPWVAKDDRDLPVDQRTIFWITPKNHSKANEHARMYARARKQGKNDQWDFDPIILDRANVTEFADLVSKVDNWGFAKGYLESRPDIAAQCNEDGFYQKSITREDSALFGDMIEQMSVALFNEILDAARSQSELEEGHPKNLEAPLS